MALPTLDATFASAADLPRKMMLAKWLVNISYSGSVADYVTLPEQYLWAKIAVAAGASRGEADYISLPKNYIWKAIYDAVSGSSNGTIDWGEKQAVGHIAAAYRGDTANPANLATYIDWPWRYQIASVITHTNIDSNAQAFITTSGATDKKRIDQFVKGVKALGLWSNMVCWPLRSTQNAGFGDTVHSLGGLGTFNGMRVNGPTWGANGLTATSTNSYVQTDLAITLSTVGEFSVVGVGNIPEGANKRLVGTNGTTTLLATTSSTNVNYILFDFINNQNVTTLTNSTVTHWVALTKNSSLTTTGYINNGTGFNRTFGSLRSSSDNLALFGSSGTSNGGVYPFFAYFSTQLTSSQNNSVYNLYKSTLGTSLGLP